MTFAKIPKPPRKILICDDEADILEMATQVLTNAGFDVTAVSGHADFIRLFDEMPLPDLILLDVRMPEHDGFWIAERVNAAAHIPIIFMTAHHCPKYQLYAPSAGAVAYIRKPFDPDLLVSEVNKALAPVLAEDAGFTQSPLNFRSATVSDAAVTNE